MVHLVWCWGRALWTPWTTRKTNKGPRANEARNIAYALFLITLHHPILCLLLTLSPWKINTHTREETSSVRLGRFMLCTFLPVFLLILCRLRLNAPSSLILSGTCFSPHVPASCLLPRERSKDSLCLCLPLQPRPRAKGTTDV